jgi:hypothetical protein
VELNSNIKYATFLAIKTFPFKNPFDNPVNVKTADKMQSNAQQLICY